MRERKIVFWAPAPLIRMEIAACSKPTTDGTFTASCIELSPAPVGTSPSPTRRVVELSGTAFRQFAFGMAFALSVHPPRQLHFSRRSVGLRSPPVQCHEHSEFVEM